MKKTTVFFKPVKFKNDSVSYLAPSWEEMGQLCFVVAKEILRSNPKFDRLIALAKGGWTWGRTMVDYLKVKNVASLQIQFYSDVYQTKSMPIIIQSLSMTISGEKILLFDDISDTGETLDVAQKYLKMCGAEEVITAVMFHKPWSKVKPDFHGVQTRAWVIFPHEIRESIRLIAKKWQKDKVSKKEIRERLIKIGLPEKEVRHFLRLEGY